MKLFLIIILIILGSSTFCQELGFGEALNSSKTECLTPAKRRDILSILNNKRMISYSANARTTNNEVSFILPIGRNVNYDEPGYYGISNYVDLDETYPNSLMDYNCGIRTYDNHKGTDYFSWPYSWSKMRNDEVHVIAAAEGTIIYKQESNQDRSCSFNSSSWNAIYLEHSDGSITWYGHLKKNSLTPKIEGDHVESGEFLGVMGSSGNSTGPHLHFEVYNSQNQLIDPYAGQCNSTTDRFWWSNQTEYYSPGINNVLTHSSPPIFGCYDEEMFDNKVNFTPGQRVYFTTYFRDQLVGTYSTHKILKPDGSIYQNWVTSSSEYFSGSYWWRSFDLPTNEKDVGEWLFISEYNGVEVQHKFYVNDVTETDFSIQVDGTCEEANSERLTTFLISNDSESLGLVVDSIKNSDGFDSNWNGIINAKESKAIKILNPRNVTLESTEVTIYTSSGNKTILVEINNINSTNSASICEGESFEFGTQTLSEPGNYIETFQASNGCDSTVTLVLNVEACQVFNILNDDYRERFSVFPNPVKDVIHIDFANIFSGKIELMSVSGRIIQFKSIWNNEFLSMNIISIPKGLYFLRITSREGTVVNTKIIKE